MEEYINKIQNGAEPIKQSSSREEKLANDNQRLMALVDSLNLEVKTLTHKLTVSDQEMKKVLQSQLGTQLNQNTAQSGSVLNAKSYSFSQRERESSNSNNLSPNQPGHKAQKSRIRIE